ncbi:type IV pilin protein [Streptomyces sp. NBC_00083]|uniref:type IV pilin protein n=1 Tax=Streptomyces sp. NBC_00083 TaxID=2975647 RepID=UPI00224EFBFC|nr:prepilin-type N-terminal cleavage/methylation domain-containing protein [Streptomyces sp. NBC_00083]MCX5384168.1 prepilin-type N-terminal cleavage/methylation domain-containing protein [Streptomyces sp. NBC_00083]
MRARHETTEAGFTLIELLVVIVILGILAAVVVFSVRGINDRGQGSACKTDKATIQTAEEALFARDGHYGTMDDLTGGGFLSSASTWYTVAPQGATFTITLLAFPSGQTNPCATP